MEIGLWLPTFADSVVRVADRSVKEAAVHAERLGFASLWTLDHVLPTRLVHSASWYDPLVALAYAAAVTERVRLGTASIVAGVRHPFSLAKQIGSLAALAGPRLTLGASSGWFDREYELFGYSIAERRGRTDECLRAVRKLLDNPEVSFEGQYWNFREAALVPRPDWHLPILVGGGSRLPEAGSDYDMPTMAPSVLARIVEHDGWLAPCAGSESVTYRDLELVRRSVQSRPAGANGFRYVHVQWAHIIDTGDREEALEAQLGVFRGMAGEKRSDDHLAQCYLMGSIDDIRSRISRLRDAGFDELIIGPVVGDPEQLELIAHAASVTPDRRL